VPNTGSEPEKIQAITQSIADNFAKRIARSPVDWHMLQRIWINEEN
jgi:KDO2-lipid IV(A) lauroyltransferase